MSTKALLQQGYRYAISLTHNSVYAEDLLHDAWVAMLNIEAPQTVPYLFKTIRNKYLNCQKRNHIVLFVSLDETFTEEDLVCTVSDFSDLLANQQLMEKSLAQLNALEREMIYLYYYEGYTTSEIATLVEYSKGTVCSLIYRARIKLKKYIERHTAQVAL